MHNTLCNTGSLVGLGGGFVLIPLLTKFGRFGQHMASGTSLAVVVATGCAGLFTFGGADAIDLPAAAMIAAAGMTTGWLGARATANISGARLSVLMSGFMVVMAPLVAFKSEIAANLKTKEGDADADVGVNSNAANANLKSGDGGAADRSFSGVLSRPLSETATMVGLGGAVGYLSGLFGVGGGSIMTPGLCLCTCVILLSQTAV